jgi:transposase
MVATQSLEQADEVVHALERLRGQLAAKQAEGDGDAGAVLAQATALIAQLRELVSTLDGQLAAMRWLAQKQFRPKSEKIAPGQLALDLLGYMLSPAQAHGASEEPTDETPAPEPPKPPRDKRKSNVRLLPVEPVECTIPEAERVCPCCNGIKTPFDHETKRHIMYEPARVYIREERLVKYACKTCEEGVVTAVGTPKLIEGSNASSSMLAHLVVSKVIDAMPIERVGKQLARHGASFATSTLLDWYGRSAEETMFLKPIARAELLRSLIISLDDTPMPAKNRGHPNGIQRGRLWLYVGDLWRIAYCEFTPDWKGHHPQRVLEGYDGRIQNDGYGGICGLFSRPDGPVRVGCNDHARRKLVEALQRGDKRVELAIALYGELYAIEREAKDLGPEARHALRQAKSVLVWQRLDEEMQRLSGVGERKSPLGKAVTYFQRQKPYLSAFLTDGLMPISNAHVERLLRAVALLRKNSLFMGSLEAGERYAMLLTLAINCTLCGANPLEYFTDLFDRLAAGWPNSRAADLLPQSWLASKQPIEQPQA